MRPLRRHKPALSWLARDYGIPPVQWSDGQLCVLGLEPDPEDFIRHFVEVFQGVRRILRDDGVLFVNMGDSYCSSGGERKYGSSDGMVGRGPGTDRIEVAKTGLKEGDLCNFPHRVAEALQADGWFWRSTMIWAKRSPMPETIKKWRWRKCRVKVAGNYTAENPHPSQVDNVVHSRAPGGKHGFGGAIWQDCPGCDKCRANGGLVLRRGKWRPTTSHEYVFMFSKSERYFCDGDAVQEISAEPDRMRNDRIGGDKRIAARHSPGTMGGGTQTRNPRTVITLSSEPYKGAHFATFPSLLVKPLIEAGTSSAGCCPHCEAPLAPIVEDERIATRPGEATKVTGDRMTDGNRDPERHIKVSKIVGYKPTCSCPAGEPVPCMVFDPFAGSGTTLQTARVLGRRYLGTEINAEYAELAKKRIRKKPRWAMKPNEKPAPPVDAAQRSLFEDD